MPNPLLIYATVKTFFSIFFSLHKFLHIGLF